MKFAREPVLFSASLMIQGRLHEAVFRVGHRRTLAWPSAGRNGAFDVTSAAEVTQELLVVAQVGHRCENRVAWRIASREQCPGLAVADAPDTVMSRHIGSPSVVAKPHLLT